VLPLGAGGAHHGGQGPLLVLTEELREETAQAVRYLDGQGVTIKVLSGDAPRAVAAIAERAGISASGPPCDASGLTDEQMGDAIGAAGVFSRVRPAQKLAAVRALQAAGHVVAMIGDGVNDVQALKQADLGIAMGTGSDASRSVARVVLLDGTFAAIPRLLDEARRVIANIERVPGFLLALAAGAPRARPGFTRRVLAFTIPAGTAAMLALLAVGCRCG
jgi:cation-transporting ATPase E